MSAGFKATEGNGGAPVVVVRKPVDKPDIPRGEMWTEGAGGLLDNRADSFPNGGEASSTATFTRKCGPYLVTYHDVQIIGFSPTFGLQAFVGPHDVVTWEKF